MDYINLLQWPGMACSLLGAYLLGSQSPRTRIIGFTVFCLSNILWTVWGVSESAYALIVLQLGLFGFNVRGIRRNESSIDEEHPELTEANVIEKIAASAE